MPPSLLTSDLVLEHREHSKNPTDEAGVIVNQLRLVLNNHLGQPDSPDLWRQFLAARRTASEAIVHLPRKDTQSLVVREARQLIIEMCKAGVHAQIGEAEDFVLAGDMASKGWPGLIAAMLLTSAWQCPSVPFLQKVPDWLMADYVRWLFAAPPGFEMSGAADAYAKHVLTHLQDLAGWVKRSPGSAAVRAAAEAYLEMDHSRALAASSHDLRAHAELRGAIAGRFIEEPTTDIFPVASFRAGRRLRVGMVADHFGASSEMRLLLPLYAQLDSERFEVQLFAGREQLSATENHARERSVAWTVLPIDEEGRLAVLRAAELDVLVFGANLSARLSGIPHLALHRIAPLQVALPLSVHTTGLPEIDLFVAGEQVGRPLSPEQFTERLGLWTGPAYGVHRELGRQTAGQAWSKTSLGIPEEAVVFVSEAPHDFVTPEVIEAWAELLAQVPVSHLILHPFGPSAVNGQVAARFGGFVQRALQRHGVDISRLLLSTLELSNPGDVQALIGVGDIYLEAFTANSVEGLLRALEAGLPVIACEGKTLRSGVGAAWLHSLGLDELVAGDASAYVATALRLATDVSARERVAATVKKHMARLPLLADTLAASDAFGALLETAFDRLVLEGAAAFVADRSPLRPAGLAPTDPQGRRMLGRQLLAEGRTARAVDHFMAALAGAEGIAELWLDVARALRANNQPKEAVQALETALRLDQSLVEGWQMLADLADLAMIPDLAAEARQIITSLVPTKGTSANGLAAAQPKVESIVNKLRSLRVARRGIV